MATSTKLGEKKGQPPTNSNPNYFPFKSPIFVRIYAWHIVLTHYFRYESSVSTYLNVSGHFTSIHDVSIFLTISSLDSYCTTVLPSTLHGDPIFHPLIFHCSVPDSELKSRPDTKDFGLKQIEGTGLSMSACREIAVIPQFQNQRMFLLIF